MDNNNNQNQGNNTDGVAQTPVPPGPMNIPVPNAQVEQSASVNTNAFAHTDHTESAIQQDIKGLKTLVQKVKEGIKQKREMAKLAKEQNPTDPNAPVEKKGMSKQTKLLILAVGIFVFFSVLLVAASLYKSLGGRRAPVAIATPTPEPQETATPSALFKPSRYATDSAVLELETLVNDLDKNMTGVDIRESQLTPPTLDFDVVFKR